MTGHSHLPLDPFDEQEGFGAETRIVGPPDFDFDDEPTRPFVRMVAGDPRETLIAAVPPPPVERRRARRPTPDTIPHPPNMPGGLPPAGHEFWGATPESRAEWLAILAWESSQP